MRWIRVFENLESAHKALEENKPRKAVVHGVNLCLIKRSDQIHAIEEFCPHRSESLSGGVLNHRGEIVCPLHHYIFDLKSGREAEERCRELRVFKVEVREDGVYLALPN
jgi:nitrite reductase/ring-hydroxylating ferredoxin subunit